MIPAQNDHSTGIIFYLSSSPLIVHYLTKLFNGFFYYFYTRFSQIIRQFVQQQLIRIDAPVRRQTLDRLLLLTVDHNGVLTVRIMEQIKKFRLPFRWHTDVR